MAMWRRIPIFLLLALLGGAVLWGCGGAGAPASDTAAASDEPLSKHEFLRLAEKVCWRGDYYQVHRGPQWIKRHEAELAKLSPDAAEETKLRAIAFPSIRKEAREIAALPAPRGDEKKIQAIVVAIEAGLKKAEKDPLSMEGESIDENPFSRASELAYNYGFIRCGNVA
jgi:hypothetical protein